MEQIRLFPASNQIVHEIMPIVISVPSREVILIAGQHFHFQAVPDG